METSESRSFALPVTESLEGWVRSMVWNPSGRFLFVHYTQARPGERFNPQSNHVGIFDTEDPEPEALTEVVVEAEPAPAPRRPSIIVRRGNVAEEVFLK
mgnify:CR=1 FL=1